MFPKLALPFALLGSACAVTSRVGPQYRLLPGSTSVVGGQATVGPGLGIAHDRFQMTIPVSLGVGERVAGGQTESALEIGTEFSGVGESSLGYRLGPLIGGGLSGTTGAYVGLRGGPTLSLAPLEGNVWTPTITLEAMVGTGLGGAVGGHALLGAGLAFGWDLYGTFHLPSGRPLRDGDGQPWLAEAEIRSEGVGTTIRDEASRRRITNLPSAERDGVGRFWLDEGLAEHASVASFLRMALELARLGAPLGLIHRTRAAAGDEIRHTRACFALATIYLGREVRPSALPSSAPRPHVSLAVMASECFIDGCVGEGAAAQMARLRARRAIDPQAQRTLRMIARDEARHAELGWDTFVWCLAEGGNSLNHQLVQTGIEPLSGGHVG